MASLELSVMLRNAKSGRFPPPPSCKQLGGAEAEVVEKEQEEEEDHSVSTGSAGAESDGDSWGTTDSYSAVEAQQPEWQRLQVEDAGPPCGHILFTASGVESKVSPCESCAADEGRRTSIADETGSSASVAYMEDAEAWEAEFWEGSSQEWEWEAAEPALVQLRGARRTLKTLRRYVRPQRVHPDLVDSPGRLLKKAPRMQPSEEGLGEDVACQSPAAEKQAFEQLRTDFWERNKEELHYAFGPDAEISRTSLAPSVEQRFMRRLHRCASPKCGVVRLGFHGTKRDNFVPIFRQGFLLPGGPGGVPIAHGNAHGRGVYTAKAGAATLSSTFCNSRSMLICGVIDDGWSIPPPDDDEDDFTRMLRIGRPAKRPSTGAVTRTAGSKLRTLGNYILHRETRELRDVGSALVVLNPSCVVPFLQVDKMPRHRLYNAAWAPAQAAEVESPEKRERREMERACWPPAGNPNRTAVVRTDEEATVAVGSPHLVAVRWRRAQLKRQRARRAAREAKFQGLL